MKEAAERGPGIFLRPPLIFAFTIVGGLLLQRLRPLLIAPPGAVFGLRVAGWLLMALGSALAVWALMALLRVGTSPIPLRPTRALAASGPYRFSRNPMYAGMTVVCVGIALTVNTVWLLAALVPALLLLRSAVIAKEERYLSERFGEAYRDYCARVRRWL